VGISGRHLPLEIAEPPNRFSVPLENLPGAHQSAICTLVSTFHIYTIIQQNCAGNKQKSHKIMRMNMFTALDKAKQDRENRDA
jgi:hypothetical protein